MSKNSVSAVIVFLASTLALCHEVQGNPHGGAVAAGSATIGSTAPNTLTVNQSSDRVIINWQDFSIGAGELTRFLQPSATAEALNRVVTANPSLLFGTLQANGRVFLINQNGILIGKGGQINTAGFLASTLNLSDDDFLKGGNLHFVGDSTAAINNSGSISALGGDVFMIAHTVENSGQIRAGTVGLAAGSDVVLLEKGREQLSVLAGNGSAPAPVGVNNVGQIEAASVELKAAGGNIYALAINNGGVVRATGVAHENGQIVLKADGGNIQNTGTLTANNANGGGGAVILDGGHNAASPATVINSGVIEARGNAKKTKGGTIEILGDHVGLYSGARVDASGEAGGGTVLVGGGLHGQDSSVHNAARTYVDPNAAIAADAVSKGDGGNVVVWADDATAFYGNISARGGAGGGDGGFAEVSGRNTLIYDGFTDLLAARGARGTLLLDPGTITIQNSGTPTTISGNQFFTDNPGIGVIFTPATVVAALNGADLTLQANTDININNTVDASGNGGGGNLTLNAGRSIILANDVAISVRGLFTVSINDSGAVAANRDPGVAEFTMGTGSSITASDGIDIEAGTLAADSTGPTSVGANTGDMTLETLTTTPATAGAAGGNIVVINNQASGKNITANGTITAGGADNGAGAGGNGGSVSLNASGTLTVNAVAASGGNGTGGAGGNAGSISFTSATDITANGPVIAQGGSGSFAGTAGNIALTSEGSIGINGSITAASFVSHSGTAGAGDTTIGVGVQINADSQSYQAGDGTGTAVVDLINNTPAFRGAAGGTLTPSSFTYEQDASIANANIPAVAQFGGTAPTTYTIQSDYGAVTLATGANVAGSALTLSAADDITLNDSLTLASLVSHSGTDGSGDTTFGPSVQINADTQSYRAGDGTGASVANLIANTPAFRDTAGTVAPNTFVYEQDGSIADTDIPAVAQFGVSAPAAYTIQSDHGAVTLTTGANVAGSTLALLAADAIMINGSLNLASLASHSGTDGSGDATFGASVQVNADSQSYRAGDGTGTAKVDLITNTPQFRDTATTAAPTAFTYEQDADIVDANIPVVSSQFGGTAPAAYTIQSDHGSVTLADGAKVAGSALTLSASGTLTVGDVLNLASLHAVGGAILLNAGSVTTTGGSLTGNQTYNGAVTLGNDATLTASGGGSITFGSTVNGAHALNVSTTGSITFGGAVGNTASLTSLAAAGGSISANGGTITTTGVQTYNGAVTLGNNATLTSSGGGSITFVSTIDGGGRNLTVSTTGTTTFGGAITGVGSLTVGSGPILLNAGTVTSTGAQVYNGAVTLGNNSTLTSSGGRITFGSTVAGGGSSLDVSTSGTTTFGGAVVGVGTLTVGSGPVALNGGTITTTGAQNYNGAVVLGNTATLTSSGGGSIAFGSTVNGVHGLVVNTTGSITFGGAVGNTASLTSLTAGSGSITVNGATITTTGAQAYNGAVTLGNNATLTSSAGSITFNSTVDGDKRLTLKAGTGTITFNGTIGGATPLTQLDIQTAIDAELNADINASTFIIRTPSHFTGPRVISADSVSIGDTMVGSVRLTLQPLTAGQDIDLGGNGGILFNLTPTELSRITVGPSEATPTSLSTPGVLQIGSLTAGNITITAPISLPFRSGFPIDTPIAPNVAVLALWTQGSIIQQAGAGITVQQLVIRAGGPVHLVGNGQPFTGNQIQFLAADLSAAPKSDRILILNDFYQPNINWPIDGLTGITPKGQVNFIGNGADVAILPQQLAGLTYVKMPPLTLSTARLLFDTRTDNRMLSLCGAGCVWTSSAEVPQAGGEAGATESQNHAVDKVGEQSKWIGEGPSVLGATVGSQSRP